MKKLTFYLLLLALTSSCALSLPSLKRSNQMTSVSISNSSETIEALKREDYKVLQTTKGYASTSRLYILFIPIGRYKSSSELYDNAYYDAVNKVSGADALLLPRAKHKQLAIPLILVNYYRKEVEITGVGISVKK
jgi:hypothetical protein